MDWKTNMLRFMKMIGEENGEWFPELWESYGISKEDAIAILDEYEKMFPDDL